MSDDPYRVLVIDDDRDIAELTATVLVRRAGCDVRVLNDPLLAADVVERFRPEVVVTDIEMPGLSGLELLAQIRARVPRLPVAVMTGRLSLDYALSALSNQADEFLTKPVPSAKLVEVVTRLAERWRADADADQESRRAAQVQRGLLPRQSLDLPGYELVGACWPARNVGGDFFDWYPEEHGVAFTLADVMGKGVGAAIVAATVRAVLRSILRGAGAGRGLGDAATALQSDLDETGSFVTMFHARLDRESGMVRWVDAGHGLSLVVRADGSSERLATPNLPLGTGLEDEWVERCVELRSGDTLISVSDGVLELWDGSLDSMTRVEELVRAADTSQGVLDALFERASAQMPDDVTSVVLRRL